MAVTNAADKTKTVADPNAEYESMKPIWDRCKAICSGERYVKALDSYLDPNMGNVLIPFSPSMEIDQYQFYKAEAELPGIVAQFAKMLVGGLLRKKPILELPEGSPDELYEWLMNHFSQDNSSMTAFLDTALWEEIQTSRAWVYVDYPVIENADELTADEALKYAPYPVLWKGQSVINWHMDTDAQGHNLLRRVITRNNIPSFDDENEFHPIFKDTVHVHEIMDGYYQIRVYERDTEVKQVPVVAGHRHIEMKNSKLKFELVDTIQSITAHGERLTQIPAWPLNGSLEIVEPILSPIVDKEVSLYNKISRRNHLLYGAATYTPVIHSDMSDEAFEEMVDGGLGSWMKLGPEDKADILKTPTDALADYEKAIASAIEEMAKLGIRMLTPETAQSGVALEIRNAAQTAQLGSLNSKVSAIMNKIIVFMLNWRYGDDLLESDISFSLSADFNPIPLGADWLRLATEWYENGIIPRSIWLQILKQNDILSPEYDDEEGQKEINEDELVSDDSEQDEFFQNAQKNGNLDE